MKQSAKNTPAGPSEFYQERNKAIYDTYLAVSRHHKEPVTLATIVEEVRQSRQPRFWVPSRTVYNIIRRYLRSTSSEPLTSKKHQAQTAQTHAAVATRSGAALSPLSRAVIATYLRIRGRRELSGKSLAFVADFVTAEPSKGFYLSHRRLFDIIRRRRKQNFKQRCAQALSGMQSYERHLAYYSKS